MRNTIILSSIILVGGIVFSPVAIAHYEENLAQQCIAKNSGSDGLICLEKVFNQTQQEMYRTEKELRRKLTERHATETITATHYRQGLSALRHASRHFAAFSQQQCELAVGYSGAVASGSGQIYWSCRIKSWMRTILYAKK